MGSGRTFLTGAWQLRVALLARAVLAIDPGAAGRRREQAQKDPRVRRWREDAGTAALAGYGLAGRHHRNRLLRTALQICAEFFPTEDVPPRSIAILQELFG